jgi:hypothetical protein
MSCGLCLEARKVAFAHSRIKVLLGYKVEFDLLSRNTICFGPGGVITEGLLGGYSGGIL